MSNLLDQYKPYTVILEAKEIDKYLDTTLYLNKNKRLEFLKNIKNKDLTINQVKIYLYNFHDLTKEIPEEQFIEIMHNIRVKKGEQDSNLHYLVYKQLIIFFDNEIITERLRELARALLIVMEFQKSNFESGFYEFIRSNQNFITYLSIRMEMQLNKSCIKDFCIDYLIREKSNIFDAIIIKLINRLEVTALKILNEKNNMYNYILDANVKNELYTKLNRNNENN